MKKTRTLTQRLKDSRSKKVIFLSHCLLNENTRYLGGACRGGCVREIIESCMDKDLGIVQMPCPEQAAWGGVLKKWMLLGYGARQTPIYRFRQILVPVFLFYTKFIFQIIARKTAGQIRDYLDSGFSVTAVVGIDGSPSCGVNKTLDFKKSFNLAADINIHSIDVDSMNAIIRQCLIPGKGFYTLALRNELKKRRIDIPFLAHDLMAELEGKGTRIEI